MYLTPGREAKTRRSARRRPGGGTGRGLVPLRLDRIPDARCGAFDFNGITPKLPTTTFSGRMTRKVGDKTVELIEVGPAHTGGDTTSPNPGELFALIGEIWKKRRG